MFLDGCSCLMNDEDDNLYSWHSLTLTTEDCFNVCGLQLAKAVCGRKKVRVTGEYDVEDCLKSWWKTNKHTECCLWFAVNNYMIHSYHMGITIRNPLLTRFRLSVTTVRWLVIATMRRHWDGKRSNFQHSSISVQV